MNAFSDPSSLLAHADSDAASETFTLRRTGRKPIRFQGWQLVDATGFDRNRPVWHDLNLYRTTKNTIVAELIVRRRVPEAKDVSHVHTFPDLHAAASWLEAFRTADDMPVPVGLGGSEQALPWAILQAVQLRQALDRLDGDYRALLTEVFAALDISDPAELTFTEPLQAA